MKKERRKTEEWTHLVARIMIKGNRPRKWERRMLHGAASLSLTSRNKTPTVDGDVYQSHCFRIVRIEIISGDSTKWHSHFRPLMLKDARQTHDERKKAINRFVEMRTHWKHEWFDPHFEAALMLSSRCQTNVLPSTSTAHTQTLCISTTTIAVLNRMRPRSPHRKLWMAMASQKSGAQEWHKTDK